MVATVSTVKDRCLATLRERGQGLVELALVTPVLLLMFLGVVDFSRAFYAYVAATNAARVGAEAAMDYRVSDNVIATKIRNEASPSVSLNSIVITPTQSSRTAGTAVQIGVTYVFSPLTPIVSSFWGGGSLPMVITATARVY